MKKDKILKTLNKASVQDLQAFEGMSKAQFEYFAKTAGAMTDITAVSEIMPGVNFNTPVTNNGGGVTELNNFGVGRVPAATKGLFDIKIKRNSANIAETLPVPVFGAIDQASDWKDVISSLLPSGCTYSVGKSGTGKGLRITYTLGMNSDTIDVECSNVPYLNLLKAGQTSFLSMSQIKAIISDAALQSQFSEAVTIFENSILGKLTKDSFTPNDFKSDLQNQNDIRTITAKIDASPETTIVCNMVASAFTFTLTSSLSKYNTLY